MIYFLIFPLWLAGLAGCGILALFRPLRVASLYLALSGTLAVWLSFALSTLALVAPSLLGLDPDNDWAGWLLIGGYLAGLGIGGALGLVLGALLARRLTKGRPILSPPN